MFQSQQTLTLLIRSTTRACLITQSMKWIKMKKLTVVLYTYCSLESLVYYMRKLYDYNLTFYSAGDKRTKCYLWSEVNGKRGSNEISTCLHYYISTL